MGSALVRTVVLIFYGPCGPTIQRSVPIYELAIGGCDSTVGKLNTWYSLVDTS